MRIFKTFDEARNEIKRDLKEMGLRVEGRYKQDKLGSFPTMELINYGYTVLEPHLDDLNPVHGWSCAEWNEREAGIFGNPQNPGYAWKFRRDLQMDWAEYLEYNGEPLRPGVTLELAQQALPQFKDDQYGFAYTYSQRFATGDQVFKVIRELRRNPESRQLYISLWHLVEDPDRLGKRRVPCSLGWHFMMREGKLHMTYTMRSCDFVTHWDNDVWLALRLQTFVADRGGFPIGHFCHFINSFHVYEKDVKDVF